jgi:hypothetical protein
MRAHVELICKVNGIEINYGPEGTRLGTWSHLEPGFDRGALGFAFNPISTRQRMAIAIEGLLEEASSRDSAATGPSGDRVIKLLRS